MAFHDDQCVYLNAGARPSVDLRAASVVKALRGVVVVEMDDPPESMGGILLPDNPEQANAGDGYSGFFRGRMRPDIGTVIAVGEPKKDKKPSTLLPGDRVICAPYKGKWVDKFTLDGYSTDRRVKFFGVDEVWWKSVIAEVREEEGAVRTLGKQCLIMFKERPDQIGGIMLPDGTGEREPLATVLICGPECEQVKPGDTVVYNSGKTKEVKYGKEFAHMLGFPGRDADLAFIDEDGIYAVVGNIDGIAA